jgi:hypothetical protein
MFFLFFPTHHIMYIQSLKQLEKTDKVFMHLNRRIYDFWV